MPPRLSLPLLLLAALLPAAGAGAREVPPGVGPRPASQPLASAAQLLGHTPQHLRLRLGEPALRRPEGGEAEVWLYATEGCALDLVLYRDRAGWLRVAFAAARAAGDATPVGTEAECLHRIGTAAAPLRPAG